MKLYTDTELDSDIKYVREVFSRCQKSYRNIGTNFSQLNKTMSGRTEFILSLFKSVFTTDNRMWT